MKKIIMILLCILFIFAGCSGNSNDDPLANYVGEGQMTVLRYLINSNAYLVEEVFIENPLPTESGQNITNENGTFALVASDKISSMADLRSLLEATYTKEAADKILAESDRYAEIDGKLYFNTKYSMEHGEDCNWSEPEIEVISVSDDTYVLEVTIKNERGWKHKLDVTAVTVDGDIRLENMYY